MIQTEDNNPPSLSEIMNEQYIENLDEKYEESDPNFEENNVVVLQIDETDEDDEIMKQILAQSLAEYEGEITPEEEVNSVDEDFIYALKLQQQEENQNSDDIIARNLHYGQFPPQTKGVNYEKVSVGVSEDDIPVSFHNESSDDEYDYESDEEYRNENYLGLKPSHLFSKDDGRLSKAELVSKHNPELNARENAVKIGKFVSANGDMNNTRIPTSVYNELKEHSRKSTKTQIKIKDQTEKSSTDHVLDSSTKVNLVKLMNLNVLNQMNGIISTGKEANVYHGICGEYTGKKSTSLVDAKNQECAIKIFKTTLNQFKNRARYIEGDFRLKTKHLNKHNPKKLINVWAEKEFRNLKRIEKAGISCPTPLFLSDQILIMSFVGKKTVPSPKLKDSQLSENQFRSCYLKLIKIMRKLYQECKLVHGDLSEYNILYSHNKPWIIDVSQAVDLTHPESNDFLRNDCEAITNFFKKQKIEPMSERELFIFITNPDIKNEDEYLENAENQNSDESSQKLDKTFMNEKTILYRNLKDYDPFEQPQESLDLMESLVS